MQGWQRNRFGLAILIFASAIVANISSLTQGQIISLIGLFVGYILSLRNLCQQV